MFSSIFTTYTLQYIYTRDQNTWLGASFCNQTSRSFNQRDIGVKTNDWALRAFYCQPWILRSSSAFYCCQIHEPFQTRGLKIHSSNTFANDYKSCSNFTDWHFVGPRPQRLSKTDKIHMYIAHLPYFLN